MEKQFRARIRVRSLDSKAPQDDIVLGPGPQNAVTKLASSWMEANPVGRTGLLVEGIEIEPADDDEAAAA